METKLLNKIKKLIRKSESAKEIGSIDEAEIFAAKVQNLLAKHNLDINNIDLSHEEKEERIKHDYDKAYNESVGGNDKYNIMRVVAQFNFCHVYLVGNQRTNKMLIVGTEENIEVCRYIHSVVYDTFLKESKRFYKRYKENEDYLAEGRSKPIGKDTFTRSFMVGCARGLKQKLQEEQEKFMDENPNGKALVKTNEVILKNYANDTFEWGKKKKGTKASNASAYRNGVKTGKNVNINKGVNSGSKPSKTKLLG